MNKCGFRDVTCGDEGYRWADCRDVDGNAGGISLANLRGYPMRLQETLRAFLLGVLVWKVGLEEMGAVGACGGDLVYTVDDNSTMEDDK